MKKASGTLFEEIMSAFPGRPLGSAANAALLTFIQDAFADGGLEVIALPFECRFWSAGASALHVDGRIFPIFAGPFSPPFSGTGSILKIRTVDELVARETEGKILLLHDAIAAEPLMPKEFPFYYPDEHRRVIDYLEAHAPRAILAITGKDPVSGVNPFPLFQDGNFSIPSACSGEHAILAACQDGRSGSLTIASAAETRPSRQLVGRRPGTGQDRIIICAHMDTAYGTPGAIDNTAGVAVLLELARRSAELRAGCTLDLVPFNGEENYAVPGQLKYLESLRADGATVRLVINLDALGSVGSKNAFSLYNLADEPHGQVTEIVAGSAQAELGAEWYAGDHAMFAFNGTPAIAVTSSDLFGKVTNLTHTERDVPEVVDPGLLTHACDAVIEIVNRFA